MQFWIFTKKCCSSISSFVALCNFFHCTKIYKSKIIINSSALEANVHFKYCLVCESFSFFLSFFSIFRHQRRQTLAATVAQSGVEVHFLKMTLLSVLSFFSSSTGPMQDRHRGDFVGGGGTLRGPQLVSGKAKKKISCRLSRHHPFFILDQSVVRHSPLLLWCFFGKQALAQGCNDSSWTAAIAAWMHIPKRDGGRWVRSHRGAATKSCWQAGQRPTGPDTNRCCRAWTHRAFWEIKTCLKGGMVWWTL